MPTHLNRSVDDVVPRQRAEMIHQTGLLILSIPSGLAPARADFSNFVVHVQVWCKAGETAYQGARLGAVMLHTSMQQCCGHAEREEVAQLKEQLLILQVLFWDCCADNPIANSISSWHIPWNISLSGKVAHSRAT